MEPTELSLLTKVKIVGAMALVGALVVAITGGAVTYQRNAKIQAAELAKTQLVNLEAMKTAFPDFRDTKQFKESKEMAMVKVSVDSLPATINNVPYALTQSDVVIVEGCSDLGVFPNTPVSANAPLWIVYKQNNKDDFTSGITSMGSAADKQGWDAVFSYVPDTYINSCDGLDLIANGLAADINNSTANITIPSGLDPGYYFIDMRLTAPDGLSIGLSGHPYQFKITPPCPTSVTLTAN